jgi:hypothetical protein
MTAFKKSQGSAPQAGKSNEEDDDWKASLEEYSKNKKDDDSSDDSRLKDDDGLGFGKLFGEDSTTADPFAEREHVANPETATSASAVASEHTKEDSEPPQNPMDMTSITKETERAEKKDEALGSSSPFAEIKTETKFSSSSPTQTKADAKGNSIHTNSLNSSPKASQSTTEKTESTAKGLKITKKKEELSQKKENLEKKKDELRELKGKIDNHLSAATDQGFGFWDNDERVKTKLAHDIIKGKEKYEENLLKSDKSNNIVEWEKLAKERIEREEHSSFADRDLPPGINFHTLAKKMKKRAESELKKGNISTSAPWSDETKELLTKGRNEIGKLKEVLKLAPQMEKLNAQIKKEEKHVRQLEQEIFYPKN